jgi:hypothetical protein
MMHLAIIYDADDADEGVYVTLGPYDTYNAADEAADTFLQYLDDEYPGHEWEAEIVEPVTVEEALIAEGKA